MGPKLERNDSAFGEQQQMFTFEAGLATLTRVDDDISMAAVSISLGFNRSMRGNDLQRQMVLKLLTCNLNKAWFIFVPRSRSVKEIGVRLNVISTRKCDPVA
jgi:hypothetical protein